MPLLAGDVAFEPLPSMPKALRAGPYEQEWQPRL